MSQPALSDSRTSLLSRKETLLSVRDLRGVFDTDDGEVHAVDGVSFDIDRGDVFAVVGESGSGKSVTAMTIMGLLPTIRIEGGEVVWKGRDLLTLNEDERRAVRGKEIAMIFQDPLTSLNPVHPVGRQIGEMARIHEGLNRSQAFERSVEMLELVGIPEPRKRAKMYPHEFSGGMRQRAMIAMAITCKPDLLIADEPTTALDVTVQAQVLEVLIGIKDEIDSAIMLITHDLGVVAGLADRVMVMYAGRQAEMGTTREIFYETRHPYTLGLLASLPRVDDVGDEPLVPIVGAPPSLIRRPSGCAFHPRCRFSRVPGPCDAEVPAFRLVGGDQHLASCHYSEELAEVSVETLREQVDVSAAEELADLATIAVIEAGGVLQGGDLAGDADAPPAPESTSPAAPSGSTRSTPATSTASATAAEAPPEAAGAPTTTSPPAAGAPAAAPGGPASAAEESEATTTTAATSPSAATAAGAPSSSPVTAPTAEGSGSTTDTGEAQDTEPGETGEPVPTAEAPESTPEAAGAGGAAPGVDQPPDDVPTATTEASDARRLADSAADEEGTESGGSTRGEAAP